MSELRKLEASIGFTSGILIGATSAGVLILFFTDWQWYFKLFSGIGSLGIMGSLYMALSELIKNRRTLLEAMEEMEKIQSELPKETKEELDELNKKIEDETDEFKKHNLLLKQKGLTNEK